MITRRLSGATAAVAACCVLALAAGGCMTVRIDESSVFEPVAFDADLAAKSGERMLGESAFSAEDAWKQVWMESVGRESEAPPPPTYQAAKVEHHRFGTQEGGLAWTRVSRAAPTDTLVVRCGGNASTRQRSGYRYTVTAIPHGDVLLFDYPGYGETGGVASPERFQAMAAELAPLVREQAKGQRIVLWGHSLGGLVCSELVKHLPEAAALIIETSARNAREVAQAWTPWYAAPFVNIEIAEGFGDIDVANALKGFKGKVLVLGAEDDQTLPVGLARSVGKALKDEGVDAAYVEFKGGGHSNLIVHPEFAGAVAGFFAGLGRGG